MEKKKAFWTFWGKYNVTYVLIMALMVGAMCYYSLFLAAVEGAVLFLLVAGTVINRKLQTRKMTDYIDTISVNVDTITQNSVTNFPYPMAIVRFDGTVVWYNQILNDAFGVGDLYDKSIHTLVPTLELDDIIKNKGSICCRVNAKDKWFEVRGNALDYGNADKPEYLIILYFIEITELMQLKQEWNERALVVSEITVDNYEEVMQNTDDLQKPQLIAALDKEINEWVSDGNGILKKIERDKYTYVFERRNLKRYEKDKFKVLDAVRSIDVGNKLPPTLSIGIGVGGKTLLEKDMFAKSAVDMALGRGGDQVVIRDDNSFHYYGGNSKEVEKRTKVKARVVAYAMRGLIMQAENVLIMGHKNADMDAIGAGLGMASTIRRRGKQVHFLLGKYDDTVANLLAKIKKNASHQGFFISKQQANEFVGNRTLIIVVDTHKQSLVEDYDLLSRTDSVVLFDHHRRSADFIEKSVLTYHESYASSTCEMVTEVIGYMDETPSLSVLEAEAMYAGIAIDTKNFTFKTGVRTFEAAAFLRRRGVDTVAVKQLLQSDLKSFVKRAEIVANAGIYRGCIAISAVRSKTAHMQTIIAQAADELLSVKGIAASFVLAGDEKDVLISGRSLGDINVQVILEQMGGGGHMTVAGAQLENTGVDKAVEELKKAIDAYSEA